MRVLFAGGLIASLILIGHQPLQSEASDMAEATSFEAPQVILDWDEYGGRLFPAFADLDGDAQPELVVGATGKTDGGRLLIFFNIGTKTQPRFSKHHWLDEQVPSARVPDG